MNAHAIERLGNSEEMRPDLTSGLSARPWRRRGLTLLELLVVLIILIGLASILIPLLPNMVTKTHTATVASNVAEINRMIQVYQQLNSGYPDQWDALSDGTTLIDYMAGGTGAPNGGGTAATQVGGQIVSGTLNANEIAALNSAGILNVHLMPATLTAGSSGANQPWDPTFNPYLTPLPSNGTPITTSTTLALLPGALANQILGVSPTGNYVLLGLGQRNKIVGRSITEPPVVFGDNPNLNPALAYMRYVVVFKVSDSAQATPLGIAFYVGALEPDDSGLHTVNHEIQQFNQTTGQ